MIPLCCACADAMNQEDCTHSDEEQCIAGTCLVDEVRKPVEMGYGSVSVFQFWGYDVVCFDKGTNSWGLFAECVNKLLNTQGELKPLFL